MGSLRVELVEQFLNKLKDAMITGSEFLMLDDADLDDLMKDWPFGLKQNIRSSFNELRKGRELLLIDCAGTKSKIQKKVNGKKRQVQQLIDDGHLPDWKVTMIVFAPV